MGEETRTGMEGAGRPGFDHDAPNTSDHVSRQGEHVSEAPQAISAPRSLALVGPRGEGETAGAASDPEPHIVKAGQVYERCDQPLRRRCIRIVAYTPGSNRADVVDAHTGQRPRSILVSALHATGTTPAGWSRRSGYRLADGSGRG